MEWRDAILMWAVVDIVNFDVRGSKQKRVAFGRCWGLPGEGELIQSQLVDTALQDCPSELGYSEKAWKA
jgi:hypothetical protein